MNAMQGQSALRRPWRRGPFARGFVYLLWLGVLVTGVYTAVGYGLLPRVIQTQALPLASQYLAGSLAAHHVSVNPFTFELRLQGLEVKDRYGDRLASVADLLVNLDLRALWSRELRFERIYLRGPWLNIVREAGGGLNLARLVEHEVREVPAAKAPAAAPYRLKIDELAVVNGVAKVTDNRDLTPATATLLPIGFTLRDLTTDSEGLGTHAVQIGFAGGGTLCWQGSVSLRPVRAAGELRIRQLPSGLPWRFLRDELKLAEPRGSLDLAARYELEWRDARPTLTVSELQAEFSDLVLSRLDAPRPFLRAARVSLLDGHYRLTDNAFSAAELRLDQPLVEAVWRGESFDWQTILARDPMRHRFRSRIKPFRTFTVALERVDITGAAFRVKDSSQQPPFVGKLHGINGTIADISTTMPKAMRVELRGRVDQQGTFEVQGQADPFDFARHSTFDLRFQDLDMAGLTPYSARFAGRKIEAGKLSLTLSYQVEDRQLAGKHRILVDDLVLGAEVVHSEPTKVPLKLAKALLQDSKGRIVLAFPVTGDLSDPRFSYAKLLRQAIGRRLTEAVASPFRALGTKLDVQDEVISEVMFAIGLSELAPGERKKLAAIADVLGARPELQLIVRPTFVPQHESDALRRQAVNRALAERLEVSTLPTDEWQRVVFEQLEVREALEGLFTRRLGAEAWAQANRQLPQDEMPQQRYLRLYERLAATEALPKNALEQLAIKRAQTVVKALRGEGRLATARIRQEAPAETAVATDEHRTFVAIELSLAATD